MLQFEWDPKKAQSNLEKHKVTFEEAATVFGDTLSQTAFDPDHSHNEERYLTMGTSSQGRLLIVSHTDRAERIRVISARTATKREQRIYEHG